MTQIYAVNTDDPAWENEKEYFTAEEYKKMRHTIQEKYRRPPRYMVYGGYVQKAAESRAAPLPLVQECFLAEPIFPFVYRITHYFSPQHCPQCVSVCYELCKIKT
jgi:hypothetical protein